MRDRRVFGVSRIPQKAEGHELQGRDWLHHGAAVLLGIAAEYTGFAFIDRRPSRVAVEAAWAAGTIAAAIAGLLASPAWLAAGFIAHVGWDLIHHNRFKRIDTHVVPGWYASACMAYDLPVGIAALMLS